MFFSSQLRFRRFVRLSHFYLLVFLELLQSYLAKFQLLGLFSILSCDFTSFMPLIFLVVLWIDFWCLNTSKGTFSCILFKSSIIIIVPRDVGYFRDFGIIAIVHWEPHNSFTLSHHINSILLQ